MAVSASGSRSISATTAAVEAGLRSGRRDWGGMVAATLLLLTLIVSLAILFILLADVMGRALPVFQARGLDFLTAPNSQNPEIAGVGQAIVGSIILTVFVIFLALPIGITAAVYLEEYAGDNRFAQLINTNIRNLAGVPAIVYGLLGLAVFVTALGAGRSLLAGGLTLAILVLPIVVITTAEALRAVPQTIREAAFGVGATRSEVDHRPCPALCPAGHPDRCRPDPGSGVRRDGAADHGRGHPRRVPDIDRPGSDGHPAGPVHRAPDHHLRLVEAATGRIQGPDRGRDHRPAGRHPGRQRSGHPPSQSIR